MFFESLALAEMVRQNECPRHKIHCLVKAPNLIRVRNLSVVDVKRSYIPVQKTNKDGSPVFDENGEPAVYYVPTQKVSIVLSDGRKWTREIKITQKGGKNIASQNWSVSYEAGRKIRTEYLGNPENAVSIGDFRMKRNGEEIRIDAICDGMDRVKGDYSPEYVSVLYGAIELLEQMEAAR